MPAGRVTIHLDNHWDLHEFTAMTGSYNDLYSFFHAISHLENGGKLLKDFSQYPWQGGYSYVNFFTKISGWVPEEDRPHVVQIKYSSPGLIELSAIQEVAADISTLIASICASAYMINKTYDGIKSMIYERKLAKVKIRSEELKVQERHLKFINEAIKQFSKPLKISDKRLKTIMKLIGEDELVSLKMLLALYRRAVPIAELQQKKKVKV